MKTEEFLIVVWHNDCTNGTHQAVIVRGHSAARAMLNFAEYLKRPADCWSFTHKNKIQLRGPGGLICDLPISQ